MKTDGEIMSGDMEKYRPPRNHVVAQHGFLVRELEAQTLRGGRDASPAAMRRRSSLMTKSSALKVAKTTYDRRFVRAIAEVAIERGQDLFGMFRDAIANAPVPEGVQTHPSFLIASPLQLTSDMRIELCRSFGLIDEILFSGHYPPAAAPTARTLYGIGLQAERPKDMRFVPWLEMCLSEAGEATQRRTIVSWLRGEVEMPRQALRALQKA